MVEPDYEVYATQTTPNDPFLGSQYSIFATTTNLAWRIATGQRHWGVTVCVIDSGIGGTLRRPVS